MKDLSASSISVSENTTETSSLATQLLLTERYLISITVHTHTEGRRVDFVPDNRGNNADCVNKRDARPALVALLPCFGPGETGQMEN